MSSEQDTSSCDVVFDYLSPHNGEYWYKCNTCKATDWFARYDTPERNYPLKGCKKQMISKETKQYLWVKEGQAPLLVTDLVALYRDSDFDVRKDKIYEIGPEVKLELDVKVTPANPIYRG